MFRRKNSILNDFYHKFSILVLIFLQLTSVFCHDPERLSSVGEQCGGIGQKSRICEIGLVCFYDHDEHTQEQRVGRCALSGPKTKPEVSLRHLQSSGPLGAFHPTSVDDPDFLAALDSGMQVYNQNIGQSPSQPLLILEVAEAESQVVSGMNYRATFSAAFASCAQTAPTAQSRASYFYDSKENKLNCDIDTDSMAWYIMQVWAHPYVKGAQRTYTLSSMSETETPTFAKDSSLGLEQQPKEQAKPPDTSHSVYLLLFIGLVGIIGLVVIVWFGCAVWGSTRKNGHPIDSEGNLTNTQQGEVELRGAHTLTYQKL